MAAPTYVTCGNGFLDAGGAWSSADTSGAELTGVNGDTSSIYIVQIIQDGSTTGAVAATLGGGIKGLDGTGGWQAVAVDQPVGSPTAAALQHIYIARADGTASSISISGTNSTSEDVYGRIYKFSGVNTGTTLAAVIENSTAGSTANGVGTSNTASDTGVTTLGDDRLALNFVAVNDDNAIAAFTGETGGDWTEAVAEYAESSGTDGAIQLQIATIADPATINGGTASITDSDSWGVVGFALRPTGTNAHTADGTGVATATGAASWGSTPTAFIACGAECTFLSTEWSGNSAKDTDTKRTGAASIKIASTALTDVRFFAADNGFTSVVTGFWIYLNGLPTVDAMLWGVQDSTAQNYWLAFDSATGKLCVAAQGDWSTRVLGPVLANQTWTHVEIHRNHSTPSATTLDWRVNGIAQTQLTDSSAAPTFTTVYYGSDDAVFGTEIGRADYTAYYDDVLLSKTAADYPVPDGYVDTSDNWAAIVTGHAAKIGAHAGVASATGAAYDTPMGTTGETADAVTATSTGTAHTSGKTVKPGNLGASAGTGAAYQATGRPGARGAAILATATGSAYNATAKVVTGPTVLATASGAAYTSNRNVGATTVLATATGSALNATGLPGTRGLAEVATATGAAQAATVNIGATAILATATGEALQADATEEEGGGLVEANAVLAESTGAAYGVMPKVGATTVAATSTGAAYNVTAKATGLTTLATATGAAYGATGKVVGNLGAATATGAALDATGRPGTRALAEAAAGTGAALDATAVPGERAPAEYAAATGAAYGTDAKVAATTILAESTGAALDADATEGTRATAVVAEATGAAANAAATVGATTLTATGSGAAYGTTHGIGSVALVAEATGAALDATVVPGERAPAEYASATGEAYGTDATVGATSVLAEATGSALDATATTTSAGQATSILATATGDAQPVTAKVAATAGAASGTGAALGAEFTEQAGIANASAKVGATQQAAALSTGTAFGTDPKIGVTAIATATGSALDATATVTGLLEEANAECATATGAAYDATALTGVNFLAEAAAATGAATNATSAVKGTVGAGAATGAAYNVNSAQGVFANAVTATGTGTAHAADMVPSQSATTGSAAATAAILGADATIGATTRLAEGTGAALDALVSTLGITYAQAGAAAITGAAYGTDAKVAPASQPIAVTGAAANVTAIKYPVKYANAGHAAGTGTAQGNDATVGATSRACTSVGAALPASFSLRAAGGIATATGQAIAGSTVIGPNAQPGAGAGVGVGPHTHIDPVAGAAAGTGTAQTPLWSDEDHLLAFVGVATGTGRAHSVLRGRTWGAPPTITAYHPRPSSRTARLVPVGTAAHLKPEH